MKRPTLPTISMTDEYLAGRPGGLRILAAALIERARSARSTTPPESNDDWREKAAAKRAEQRELDRAAVLGSHDYCLECDRPLAGTEWRLTEVSDGLSMSDPRRGMSDLRRGVHLSCRPLPPPYVSPTDRMVKQRELYERRLSHIAAAYGRDLTPFEAAQEWQEMIAEGSISED